MKLKLLIATLAAFLALSASAGAFVWHLSYYKVKAATKADQRRICERDNQCIAYGASCERITESRIDCIGGTIDESEYGELECTTVYHWGVRRGGTVKVRLGGTHCYYLE